MLVPVRCFSCGNLIADKYAEYTKRVAEGGDPGEVLDSMNMHRYCCRRMFLTTVETVSQITPFFEAMNKRHEIIQQDSI